MTSKLAFGSEWLDNSRGWSVIDIDGILINASVVSKTVSLDDHGDRAEAYASDVLAVIDFANLDPVRVVARELIRNIHLWKVRREDGLSDEVPGLELGGIQDELDKLEALL